MHILRMEVGRWPKHQVCAHSSHCRWQMAQHQVQACSSHGRWPKHYVHTFFTQVGRWPKHQVHACTCAYFSYGRWLKHQAHRCVHSLYMKMAQTPGTRIFTWKLADFPNTRYTCMHARIFFMWKSPDDPTPGTHMHAHTYSSYGDQQMAQIPGTRMHAHTHILHLEISRWPIHKTHPYSTPRSRQYKINLSLSCSLSMVYYWVRIDNCRLHVDNIYWSSLEHAIISTSIFPFLHTASFITVFSRL